ncbi:hypothetical protein VNN41_09905 [Lactococcus garvieae]|uniref:hypothetical protein n=1 Tax=Lactococcus garvieae TaxID=1363 RepID=UPI00324AB3BA
MNDGKNICEDVVKHQGEKDFETAHEKVEERETITIVVQNLEQLWALYGKDNAQLFYKKVSK